jgi:hypothetical protein
MLEEVLMAPPYWAMPLPEELDMPLKVSLLRAGLDVLNKGMELPPESM